LLQSLEKDKVDQDPAIKSLVRLIQWDEDIPPEYQGFVKKYLNFAYVMGYEEGNKYLKNPRTTIIKSIDENGNEKVYNSVIEAAKVLKCPPSSISRAMLKSNKNGNHAFGLRWEKIKSNH
jgi:hypothetical protein